MVARTRRMHPPNVCNVGMRGMSVPLCEVSPPYQYAFTGGFAPAALLGGYWPCDAPGLAEAGTNDGCVHIQGTVH